MGDGNDVSRGLAVEGPRVSVVIDTSPIALGLLRGSLLALPEDSSVSLVTCCRDGVVSSAAVFVTIGVVFSAVSVTTFLLGALSCPKAADFSTDVSFTGAAVIASAGTTVLDVAISAGALAVASVLAEASTVSGVKAVSCSIADFSLAAGATGVSTMGLSVTEISFT